MVGAHPEPGNRVTMLRAVIGARYLAAARAHRRPGSPAELARRLDPTFNITPTIALLSDIGMRAVTEPNQRDIATAPPRTGKSQMIAIWTPVWALMTNPDMQIVVLCNGDDLAQEHSRAVREIVREHADFLGYRIALDKTAVGRWRVEGRKGGMLAAGIHSHIVGFGADLMILDDVVGGAVEADSAAHRRRVLAEYQGSLSTRIHPGGSSLLVMTRWHERDLAGELLNREPEWRHTNVTAVGDPAVPDALHKPAGVAMVSALGFTPADFARRRRAAGERMWYAQYMGVPSAPEGGLVKKAWLDDHRLLLPPRNPTLTVVGVDPAESGSGDEAGIVAASLTQDGSIVMIADKTAQMTSDEWVKASVALAVEVGASRIVVEAFSAGETYRRLLTEEVKQADRDIAVVAWPPRGSRRGGGDSHTRSAALLAQLENGLTRLAGHFPDWETRATGWQAGQHQPDGLSALVVAHDELIHAAGLEWDMAMPFESAAVVSLESWMSRPLS